MARYSDTFIEEVRARTSLEEIVSLYVPLKQKGRRFWGCCPFHNEKTPSFSVDSQTQLYYCFGCHKGGSVFTFVCEMERMEFPEAVQYLAERAHMQIPEPAGNDQSRGGSTSEERERIYEANVIAARYFHSLLWTQEGAQALSYLYKRGLNDSDIRHFGLGAAPNGWDTLTKHLEQRGFEARLLKKAGLAVERDGRYFDMFRGRVIFPIINVRGKVLGFGGRAMGDAQPKYLNTPDTPVFNKRQGLYSMNFVRDERDVRRLVLVEGYMDTVSLRKYGVRGVVATLGTALTPEQAKLIKRYAAEVWISYDGDSAGQKAALRALNIFDEVDGITARVVDYPGGQDPDDFIRANGLVGFEKLRKYDATRYRMLRAEDGLDLSTQEGLTQYTFKCCDILRKVSDPIIMENHLRELAKRTGYDREILLRQVGKTTGNSPSLRPSAPRKPKEKVDDVVLAERVLLTLVGIGEIPRAMVKAEDFAVGVRRDAATWILSGKQPVSFIETIQNESERDEAVKSMNYTPLPEDHDGKLELAQTSLHTIRRARLNERIAAIQEELKTADDVRKRELYTQMQTIMGALED